MILYSLLSETTMTDSLFAEHFSTIEDPRQQVKVTYKLFDVLFLTVSAVVAGCDGWEQIEDFGRARLSWLRNLGFCQEGIPVHDTIARLIARIDPAQLQSSFINWMQAACTFAEGEVVAIDGKTLRSSYNRDDRQSAIHMVSAFATANGVVMGQVKTDEKSNEITAIPELLKVLELKGSLVTIDAMGCQKNIARTIVNKEADYLLAVKGNQGKLYEAIQDAFYRQDAESQIAVERKHGRIDGREYKVLSADVLDGSLRNAWPKLTTLGVAVNYRKDSKGKDKLEHRYYISSAKLSTERFAASVRSHWGIENKLHWTLDTALNEDACQIYRENAAQNLATIRHVSVNMLRSEKSRKASVPRKRKMAAMESKYLAKVMMAGLGNS